MRKRPVRKPCALVVGIAGGSGCGKTTLARRLAARLGDGCALLAQDVYYHDVAPDFFPPSEWNYDHPDALDLGLMADHVRRLKHGEAVDIPAYDFGLYQRTGQATRIAPAPVIIVEGTLLLANQALRNLLDLRVYVDTPDDLRFIRRLRRDLVERGRDVDTVIQQYMTWNRPMHQQFVAPSRACAQVIIPNGGLTARSLDVLLGAIREMRPDVVVQTGPEALDEKIEQETGTSRY